MGSAYSQIKRGPAADLGTQHYKSAWERNVARWLNRRVEEGEILCWEYEPLTFTFSGVTRGAVCYTPDFLVIYPDYSTEWLEVKGWETGRDRTKWKRFRAQYPQETLTVLGSKEYRSLSSRFGGLKHWE